ncbi:MAG: hypothetical protein EXS37_11305 [Opitutus sp.]|nr:hypothetical protein [Opitutus sp.]
MALLPEADMITRAQTLPIEERRQLVYLYARLNKPKVAEALAAQILADAPSDRQTLLVLASMYLGQKDAAATLRTAHLFLGFYPGDHQGRYFLGAGHYLAKEFAEANRVLRDLKLGQFVGRKYPYETDLAASAYAAGDWYRAMLSYQELLRHHSLGDELRNEVRRVLDGLYREHLPRIEATVAETRLDRARVWRYTAGNAQHRSDRHWLAETFTRDDVSLEATPGLRAARAGRAEAAATLTTTYDRRWRTDGWAGASREGLLAGGRVHLVFAKEREVALEFACNERATDSLAVEALDGRQNRAGLVVNWLIEADLAFVGRINARELRIGGERIGRGTGVDASLDQTLWRQGPRIVAGYRGSVARFSSDAASSINPSIAAPIADPAGGVVAQRGIIAALVSRRINRHGGGIVVTDTLADAWHYRLTAGADYDFELESIGWNGGLSLSFWPRKSIELTAEAGYTSSAGASNAGSSATLLTFFVRTFY